MGNGLDAAATDLAGPPIFSAAILTAPTICSLAFSYCSSLIWPLAFKRRRSPRVKPPISESSLAIHFFSQRIAMNIRPSNTSNTNANGPMHRPNAKGQGIGGSTSGERMYLILPPPVRRGRAGEGVNLKSQIRNFRLQMSPSLTLPSSSLSLRAEGRITGGGKRRCHTPSTQGWKNHLIIQHDSRMLDTSAMIPAAMAWRILRMFTEPK